MNYLTILQILQVQLRFELSIKCHKNVTWLKALASGNATLSYFSISKNYFINYTIPFYNTSNIPKFYFTILHIKIIYLRNKIYFFFFSFFFNFLLHLPSTSITAPPLPSHHHRASTRPTTPPLPTAHQNPTRTKTHIKKKKTIRKAEPRRTSQPCSDPHHDPCRSPPNPSS